MKKRATLWKDSVVKAFELPADLAYGSVLLSVTGRNEILIENYPLIDKRLPDPVCRETPADRILHQ